MEATISMLVEQYEQGRISRRDLVRSMAILAGLAVQASGTAAVDGATFEATGLNHLALSVTDVGRSRDFYVQHLGLTVSSDASPRSCFLDCGPNFVALFRARQAGMHHYCYSIVDYDQQEAAGRLRSVGIEPELRGGRIYFSDPDGLTVQLAAEARGG